MLMPIHSVLIGTLDYFPFKISLEKITYLGIEVKKRHSSLFQANFQPLIDRLQNKIQFWRTLSISLLGRVNSIKMIFLPQLLYLMQNIQIFLQKAFFKRLDSIILPFLWNYKAHRINKKHLSKPKHYGGLALPNFVLYHWASAIQSFTFWLDTSISPPDWLTLQQEDCHPYFIGAILLTPTLIPKSVDNHNPVIFDLIRTWKQIKSHFGLKPLSLILLIDKNPTFIPSRLDKTFFAWNSLGIHTIHDLYIEGTFATFAQLQHKFNLPNNNSFRYLQIKAGAFIPRQVPIYVAI